MINAKWMRQPTDAEMGRREWSLGREARLTGTWAFDRPGKSRSGYSCVGIALWFEDMK